jgi:hypothetical protein
MVASDSSRDSNNPLDNAIVNDKEQIETAKWTRHLPEAFGIRAAVQQSKYRWCVREAALWGIATGTTVSLHRLRMKSSVFFSINAGFLSCWVVYAGSYYFCFKRRDYQEKMIETMMKLNTFQHAAVMPPEIPINEDHPFVLPTDTSNDSSTVKTRQYVATLPERKEWQKQLPTQDAASVFKPIEKEK